MLLIERLNVILADFRMKSRQARASPHQTSDGAIEEDKNNASENCKFYLTPDGEVYAESKAEEEISVSAEEAQAVASIEAAYALIRIADKLDSLLDRMKKR